MRYVYFAIITIWVLPSILNAQHIDALNIKNIGIARFMQFRSNEIPYSLNHNYQLFSHTVYGTNNTESSNFKNNCTGFLYSYPFVSKQNAVVTYNPKITGSFDFEMTAKKMYGNILQFGQKSNSQDIVYIQGILFGPITTRKMIPYYLYSTPRYDGRVPENP